MLYFYTFLFAAIILITLYIIRSFVKIGTEIPSIDKRKLHSTEVNRLGGLVFFALIILFPFISSEILESSLIFAYLIAIIGFSEDIFNKISQYIRFILLVIITLIFVTSNNLMIHEFDNYYINRIITSIEIISYLFVFVSLLFSINGFNFIDGINGLLLGFSIIVVSIFSYYCFQVSDSLFLFCICLNICCSCLFIINFFTGKILTGDGGAYFLGFIIGSLGIIICNEKIISASGIAFIICYPIIEICFSFVRRLFSKEKNSFNPDNLHLHQLMYYYIIYLNKKYKLGYSPKELNSFSSLCILMSILLILLVGLNLKEYIDIMYFFIGSIFLYFILYFKLFNYYNKKIS